jgi:DNA uptake protein ComE-like DNA-binding protein
MLAVAGLMTLVTLACGDSEPDRLREAAGAPDTVPMAAPVGETGTAALVDPNTASEEELAALPGLDSAGITIVLEGRPFPDMTALDHALSATMDSASLEALYREMFIPLDLNSASRETILLIPGVGERMAREFLEYRPYRGIEEFRREIGKYVDDAEVERLERYVTVGQE